MRWSIILMTFAISACAEPQPEELMFIRKDAAAVPGDPGPLFFNDALTRLTPEEKSRYDRSSDVAGFLFQGEKFTCIVVVTLGTDVISHAPDPAFCYDKGTNEFVERL